MKSEKFYNLRAPDNQIRRQNEEEFDTYPYRTEFGRDRDRILYSKAFRRLKGKTQVFLSSGSDHLRTRLTHTLEVSQIARTIINNLQMNETLTEAIALGHDLGHTPFGHVGERTLNQIMNNCDQMGEFQNSMDLQAKGFKHNWQGLRVVCDLEKLYGNNGLNLTNFTLWGILNHSGQKSKFCQFYNETEKKKCYLQRNPVSCTHSPEKGLEFGYYSKYKKHLEIGNHREAWSFEGYVVALADEIAQRHHDMEDALNLGIINRKELIDKLTSEFKDYYSGNSKNDFTGRRLLKILQATNDNYEFMPYLSKFIVNFYTNNLIETSRDNLSHFIKSNDLSTRKEYLQRYPEINIEQVKDIIGYPEGFSDIDADLQTFLRNRILNSHKAQQMDGKGRFIIRRLFKAYITNPRQLFDSTILAVFRNYAEAIHVENTSSKEKIGVLRDNIDSASNKSDHDFQIALLRAICDNISGMTDDFAMQQHQQLYS